MQLLQTYIRLQLALLFNPTILQLAIQARNFIVRKAQALQLKQTSQIREARNAVGAQVQVLQVCECAQPTHNSNGIRGDVQLSEIHKVF